MSIVDDLIKKTNCFDISFYQENKYTAVKVSFYLMKQIAKMVIIRVGQGQIIDSCFQQYYDDSTAAGIKQNYYFFLDWQYGTPEEQATYFWNSVKDKKRHKWWFEGRPVSGWWVDFEWWTDCPSDARQRLRRFIDKFYDLSGEWLGIYTSPGFWASYDADLEGTQEDQYWAEKQLWIAHWNVNVPLPPGPWKRNGKNPAIHQWGTPVVGPDILYNEKVFDPGVESKEIDADIICASDEDFYHYEGDYKMQYTNYAKGIFVDPSKHKLTADDLEGMDFAIVKSSVGKTMVSGFTDALNPPYAKKIPVLAFHENWPQICAENMGFDESKLPNAANEQQMAVMKQQFMMGSTMRYIHGLILDMGHSTGLTDVWLYKYAQHMLGLVWNTFVLPNYAYLSESTYKDFQGSQADVFLQHNKPSLPCQVATSNGIPADGTKPKLYYDLKGEGKYWYFWFYDNKEGISYVLYNGTKESLYSELSFVPSGTTDPGTTDPGTTDPGTTDPGTGDVVIDSSVKAAILKIGTDVAAIRALLEGGISFGK